jgi:hypothetical protein
VANERWQEAWESITDEEISQVVNIALVTEVEKVSDTKTETNTHDSSNYSLPEWSIHELNSIHRIETEWATKTHTHDPEQNGNAVESIFRSNVGGFLCKVWFVTDFSVLNT